MALERWPATASRATRARGSPRPRATSPSTGCAARRSVPPSCRRSRCCRDDRRRANRRRDDSGVEDDRLRLIFTCCHPALALEAQVALDVAHAGRPDHRRDRAGVPRPRADDGAAAWCARSARSATPASRTGCRPRTCCPSARSRCWRCSTCCSTRATPRRSGADLVRQDCAPRRSGCLARSPS